MSILHITLATKDVKQTAAFFRATLGFEPIDRPGNIAFPAAWLRMGGGQEVHLVEIPDFQPSAFEREFGRHVAVAYPASGFAALKQRLAANGAELIEPARDTPVERFFFRDPNGYIFEVVSAGSGRDVPAK